MGTKLRVLSDIEHTSDDDGDCGDGLYSRNDTTHKDHTITGIRLSDSGFYDVLSMFEVKPDVDYFLVSIIYSDGDSFSVRNGNISYVDIFDSAEKAAECRQMIVDHNNTKCNDVGYTMTLKTNGGLKYSLGCVFAGWFEQLTTVKIDTVRLQLDEDY